jgi:hypothetical protein
MRWGGSRDTGVMISSIAQDQPLEDFWAEHTRMLPPLCELNLLGMTTPNFSFMSDVPRTNSLYNQTRIFRIAERMTKAGIPTILHLQASTRRDWARWAELMKDQPAARFVALEFQTGPRERDVGDRYYFGLVGLQEELGRPLHPLVFAGGGRIDDLAKHFYTFSVIDSTPFMKTVNRQSLRQLPNNKWKWRPQRSKPGESLDILLACNIAMHRARMLQKTGLVDVDNTPTRMLLPPAA